MATITTFIIGFSVIISAIFFVVYAFFLKNVNKSYVAMGSCCLLLLGLSCLQVEHFRYLQEGGEPLATVYYRLLIFTVPSMFYIFSRSILFPDTHFSFRYLLLLLPLGLAFFVGKAAAAAIAFVIGTIYCLWMLSIVYRLRAQHKRFAVELFFFGYFAALGVLVLIMGLSVSFIDSRYFYLFYANSIGLAFVLVAGCFMIWPDLLIELREAVALSYANSTLKNIDVDESLKKLHALMEDKIYQNENLNLASVAAGVGISSHQLSELINTHFNQSFSKYIRAQRVEEAKRLLKENPEASILSIGLEVGFKSQSNFYSAFSEITGMTPGQFR